MKADIFLFTPPFTQLNTPYPATAYLKGFLNTKEINCFQADLGIEVILSLFSGEGLKQLFSHVETLSRNDFSENAQRIIALKRDYISSIDSVIHFLQGKNPTLALQICQDDFLPEASRFNQLEELDWAFGTMGTQDKAKHLSTLYLEDLSDFIVECVDPNFGFSRYAERLGRSANSFDELYWSIKQDFTYIDTLLIENLEGKIERLTPRLVLISVPFPGNLYAAFRCAAWIKENYPDIKTAMGGGFPNTELRTVKDIRVFEFFDYITLDDGELPVELLYESLKPSDKTALYKRTFMVEGNQVVYCNDSLRRDYKQMEVGTPDYSDLLLDDYISVIEMVNPMHRMWSDGRWNKLTMAHGCYWGKCTFCDISLPYIKDYESSSAVKIVDRMEELIGQTGQNGFHFVDEAAPPALMRDVALEILRRRLVVTWWTNIRFEKSFSMELCRLLKLSGCIAVSGGLEVASDRLLKLIDKGVTVPQVAQVTRNFTEAGIMVHAYLMYGYPTQTVQETVDSLEMVRQLFELGIVQSGFWHQFAMTAHSPVGLNPTTFGVVKCESSEISFANNDIEFRDLTGVDHDKFSYGLKKSLFNYMHGLCFDFKLQEWFDFKIPRTTIAPNYINESLKAIPDFNIKATAKVFWLGNPVQTEPYTKNKRGASWEMIKLAVYDKRETHVLHFPLEEGQWLMSVLDQTSIHQQKVTNLQEIKDSYPGDFELFWFSKPVTMLKEIGLLVL